MKRIVIVPNLKKDRDFAVTEEVVEKLLSIGCEVYVHRDSIYVNGNVHTYDRFPKDAELILVIGGDGSMLDASPSAIENNIPILGVNLGKVGYLTEVEIEDLHILDRLVVDDYTITEKMLLSVSFDDKGDVCDRYAVNDVTVSRDNFTHIAEVGIEDSIGNIVKIRVDGVIFATPQGSTAYSFSSGGPIVAHDVESILLTPVSPHSFFNRSVIFNSSEVIKITNFGELPLNVFIDGRCYGNLLSGKSCRVSKATKNLKVLTFKKNSMFSSLFKKMRILGDID